MTDRKQPDQPDIIKPKHWVLRGLKWCALITMALAAVVAIAAVTLVDREISAPDWLKTRLESVAADSLAGGTLRFGTVTVTVGRDLHPRVTLRDTVLRDAAGTTLARIPVVRGGLSPRGLVLQRAALMQDVHIGGAQINLRRNADGTVALAFQSGSTDVGQAETFAALLDQSDRLFERSALAALETVSVDGVIINYQDARAGKAWTMDGGEIALDLRGDQTDLRGAVSVLSGGADVTDLVLTYVSPHGSRAAEIALTVTDARAADIAAQSAALSWLADIDAPISVALRTGLDATGALGPLNATLDLGQGAVQPNPATAPIRFDAAKAYLKFDPAAGIINFDQVEIRSEWGQTRATGQALLQDITDGLPRALVGQFSFTGTRLNPPDLYDDGLDLPQMQVDMRLTLRPFAVDLGQVFVQTDAARILGKGHLAATDQGWDVGFDARIGQLDHAGVLQFWPVGIMAKVRSWVAAQITQARFEDIYIALRKHPGQPVQAAGHFAFADTHIKFLKDMPPLTGAAGVGSFTTNTFTATLNSGIVTAAVGGAVDASGSTLHLPDLKQIPRPAEYDLRLDGSMTATLALMDLPPLSLTSKAKLPVDVAQGRVRAQVDLTHPMRRGNTPSDVGVQVNAVLENLRTSRLIPNRRLSADRLVVTADKTRLEIGGAATIDGVPVTGDWVQRFDGTGSRLQAAVTLSQDGLNAFNIALPPGTVAGRTAAAIDLRIAPNVAPRYTITSDLRGLRVAIPAVGWAKSAQTRGDLRLEGRLGAAPQVDLLHVQGGGLDARGDITFRSDGTLDRARFSHVQLGNWLNAPITLRGRGAGRPVAVEIGGGTLDLRRATFGGGGGEAGPMSIALDRLQVTESIALHRFVGNFTGAGGFAGTFTARVNDAAQVQGTVAPSRGRSAVRLVSDDAGGVARAAGLLRNGFGGSLDLTLFPTQGAGTFNGRLAVRNLRIRDAPVMAALLDAISVVGLLQQLDGQGLAFDAVDAQFRLTPEQVIVTQASAVGPGLGISLDGIYMLASKQMDFQGVLSPFYVINSIGSVLTRAGEGLIGFNFTLQGRSDAPQIGVNPLSVLTPGMFRDIFRNAPPQVPQ